MSDLRPSLAMMPDAADLLLRETNHRCANDLQLVVSLLSLQSRRATSTETRQAIQDTLERVSILARARASLVRHDEAALDTAIREACEALHAQSEPRGILVSAKFCNCPPDIPPEKVMAITLAVNELATNAIKHAFVEGAAGRIDISVETDNQFVIVTVDDDGLPFAENAHHNRSGLGLGLVDRLIASTGGRVIKPREQSKVFKILVPLQD